MTRYFKLAAALLHAFGGVSFVAVLFSTATYQDAPTWAAVGFLGVVACSVVSYLWNGKGKP